MASRALSLRPAGDLTPTGADCPRCGMPVAELQEYCLECGQRLSSDPDARTALRTAGGRQTGWYAGDWVWPVLVGLVVAVLAAVAVIAARSRDEGTGPLLVATEPPVALPATNTTPTTPASPQTASLPALPETEPTRAPSPPPARPGQLTEWPAGTNGFTVVLASDPGANRTRATAKAKKASEAGLSDVGVVDSSEYSSLHPGYLVVFAGIYETRAEAEAAIENARAKGYNDAYPAQVAQ
jgi:hypothetical protein